jgi:hypothetical protein
VFATTFGVTIFLAFLAFAVTLTLHLAARTTITTLTRETASELARDPTDQTVVNRLDARLDRIGPTTVTVTSNTDNITVTATVTMRTSRIHQLLGINNVTTTATVRRETLR